MIVVVSPDPCNCDPAAPCPCPLAALRLAELHALRAHLVDTIGRVVAAVPDGLARVVTVDALVHTHDVVADLLGEPRWPDLMFARLAERHSRAAWDAVPQLWKAADSYDATASS